MKKILIIDDEKDIRFLLSSILVDEGYFAIEAGDIAGAEKKIDGEFFDLALIDISLGDKKKDGISLLKKKKKMTQKKKETIKSLAIHDKDVGSAEVQVGLLTDKITKLSEHFKKFKKDKHSTVGLTKSVNRRKKLLAYLKKKNPDSYNKVIKQLNLRK